MKGFEYIRAFNLEFVDKIQGVCELVKHFSGERIEMFITFHGKKNTKISKPVG